MSDNVSLNSIKTLVLRPEHVAYILNMLSECKFKDVRLIIADIMGQLKEQEGGRGTGGSD
jgi:hypothetical protein